MKKFFVLFLCLCAFAASLNAAENPMVLSSIAKLEEQLAPLPELTGKERVGVLVTSLSNPYWVTMKERYGEWAEKMGVVVEVMAPATDKDPRAQLDLFEAMIARQYDAIIVTPLDGMNLVPGVLKANEKKVPVVCSGPAVSAEGLAQAGAKMDGWISAAFLEQGRLCAEDMAKKLPAGSSVAVIEGKPGAMQSRLRREGAIAAFEAAGMKVVAVQAGNWDRNEAYNIATNMVKAHPELKGLYCANDVMALAAVDAFEVAGVKNVMVYGTDFIPQAKEAIAAGRLTGSTTFSQAAWTRGALIYTLKLSKGLSVPERLGIPITLVTSENINNFESWK
ncbi:sugar-binding domain protein [Pyramidobacter piscolens W5455]|uniref:Sugar-binding domain protein n=1 Tax=Pyramidobacter piscolens W5455 TaxID=352165 RepID=A0ABM9ZRU3_9BACT|nr:substrate-binding domain-containing protein [Pyramidobacter piscolens]EFB89646.1 sugar-binding domain protein [Pyramidobacter piscolens W5455]